MWHNGNTQNLKKPNMTFFNLNKANKPSTTSFTEIEVEGSGTCEYKERLEKAISSVNSVILGKEEQVKLAFTCLLAGGHLLIEDIPGTGKTVLAKTLGSVLSLDFKRIQFTSDLLPSDILGVNIYKQQEQKFELHEGPVFTNLLLADEINRASPKTQSALLEVMSEGQVSIEGITKSMDNPFMVIATQNPLDYSGTFALPDAQKDRFLFCISMGYPNADCEKKLMHQEKRSEILNREIQGALAKKDIEILKDKTRGVRVNDNALSYAHDLVSATRNMDKFYQGLSTRAAIALVDGAKAYAFIDGREYVTPEDFQAIFIYLSSHRVKSKNDKTKAELENIINQTKLS